MTDTPWERVRALLQHPLLSRDPVFDPTRCFRDRASGAWLRFAGARADEPPIRGAVNIARVAQAAETVPAGSAIRVDALDTLVPHLDASPPGLWNIFPGSDPEMDQAAGVYSTSQIMLGLGVDGWGRIQTARRNNIVVTMNDFLRDKLLFEREDSPFLVVRAAQAMLQCSVLDARFRDAVGAWANRYLYRCEATASTGDGDLAGINMAVALGALTLTRPEMLTRKRASRLTRILFEDCPILLEEGRRSLMRVGHAVIGYSAIDVLLLFLADDATSGAMLHRPQYVEELLQWLLEHSSMVEDQRLYRSDVYPDEDKMELWFNAAVWEFLFVLRKRLIAADSRHRLTMFRVKIPEDALPWTAVKVGGHRWPAVLKDQLVDVAAFRIPRGEKLSRNGVLLFGPPGTGKTSFVDTMARSLGGWRVVVLSPGDFLTSGEDGLVGRITTIFDELSGLQEAVVLFDEFELLLLDRSGKDRFATWTSALLTDVMLPHFKNLHDWGRNIYVVCTNDIQRIDFAARRAGRFDFICPVGPPSIAEAEEMLKSWMPPGLRAATLAKATRGRATFHELREWARVTADEKHDEAAALLNWSTHFQPRLTISDALWEKYQRDCAEYTYP